MRINRHMTINPTIINSWVNFEPRIPCIVVCRSIVFEPLDSMYGVHIEQAKSKAVKDLAVNDSCNIFWPCAVIFFVFFSSHNMLNRGVTCPRRHINWPGDRLRADADCPCAHLPHSSTRCNLSVQALLNPNRRCISRPMYACEDTHEFRQGWGVVILYARQVATNKSAGGSHRPARFCRS